MKRIPYWAACAALLFVAGCGKSPLTSKDADLIDSSPGVDTSKITPEGEADFLLAYQYVQAANVTGNMPNSGSARYIGGMGADATGNVSGFMTGAMEVTVTDLNNGAVSGFVDNFAVYNDDGSKDRDLNGAITLRGNVVGNSLDTAGSGTIRDGATASTMNVDVDGTFRDLDGRASAVTGTVVNSSGKVSDITLNDGKFYLVEND